MSDPTSIPMPGHLSPATLAALADGELAPTDLARASQHLAACAACTTRALHESLLKRATARAGQRYAMPDSLSARIQQAIAHHAIPQQTIAAHSTSTFQPISEAPRPQPLARPRLAPVWTASLAAVLLVTASGFLAHDLALRSVHSSALVAETVDEHIAALAAAAPQVVSTDRHTVKPWFQGKLPFSFGLPATLPQDVTLDGANLVQLNGQPAAQLLFSIGKHHASLFLRQRNAAHPSGDGLALHTAEHNGFHVEGFRTPELDVLAVSDADPSRLHSLALAMQDAQAGE